MTTPYDEITSEYVTFVDGAIADAEHILNVASEHLCVMLGDVANRSICDLGCGEGHLSRRLAQAGAAVVGVDSSRYLLEEATRRSTGLPIQYVLDDAQSLLTRKDREFDRVVSNFAIIDIPSLAAVYRAVYRVLRPGGQFLFSITHPCFQLPRTDGHGDEMGK